MKRQGIHTLGLALMAVLIAVVVAPTPSARAQGGVDATQSTLKFNATLTAPDGATNTRATGKAKASVNDNGSTILQKLQISAQKLDRGVDYRVLIDGVDFGVYSSRGGSGSLVLRFRDPVKGHLLPFPEGVTVDVTTFVAIEIVNDTTGEVVLSGTFAPAAS